MCLRLMSCAAPALLCIKLSSFRLLRASRFFRVQCASCCFSSSPWLVPTTSSRTRGTPGCNSALPPHQCCLAPQWRRQVTVEHHGLGNGRGREGSDTVHALATKKIKVFADFLCWHDASTMSKTGVNGNDACQLGQPYSVMLHGSDSLVISDGTNRRVQVCSLASPGTACTTGGGVDGRGSDSGQLDNPRKTTVDSNGDFVIADGGNNQVQLCSSSGVCSTVVETGTSLDEPWLSPSKIQEITSSPTTATIA